MDLVERLGPKALPSLCLLNEIFIQMGICYSLIGATALLLHRIDLPRTTQDLDVVVAIHGSFTDTLDELVARGFRRTKTAHRVVSPQGTQVDILPVSHKSAKTGVIAWPDGTTMTAVGLKEALDLAVHVLLPDCEIRAAPLPILAGLKLIASTSEQRRGKDDLNDLLECLEQYELQGERRFSVYDLTDKELTFDQAGAYLLGHELKTAVQPVTLRAVRAALSATLESPLPSRRLRTQDRAEELLLSFQVGLNPNPSGRNSQSEKEIHLP